MVNQFSRRLSAVITSLAVALMFIVPLSAAVSARPAAAAEASTVPPLIDNPSNAVTADALPTAQINGVAWDQVVIGNTVYVAGEFTSARPAGSPRGSNESPRHNLMSYNLTTGAMTSWAPNVNGRIRVIAASRDGSRVYIGGNFTQVDGKARSRIAAFSTATGALISTFAPVVGSDVFAIAATNSVVYLGGWFTAVNNTPRARLAAVNASDGSLTAWAPSTDHTIWAMDLTTSADRVVVAGSFTTLNGATATSLGTLAASDGTSYPFAANQIIHNYGNSAAMMSMKVVDNKAYSGSYWYGGTGNFEGGLIADAYDGTVLNLANCLGDTYDFVPMNGLAYMVSHHHQCTDIGGFTEKVPRMWQHNDAVTIEATGLVQNTTYGYPNFGGNPSGSYVNWFPVMQVGTATGIEQAGWTVETSGQYLVMGGEFPTVNGIAQEGLVRFTTRANGAPKKVGPSATGSSITPSVRNVSLTSARVRFQSDFDRDGMNLSYVVQRRVLNTTAITAVHTTSATSTFWLRPYLQFIDTTLVAGTTYQHRLKVTDADGNVRYSLWATTTAGTNVPVASVYSDQVFADGALNYWRLSDPVGSTSITDWATGDDLTAPASGLTLGAAGAIIGSTDPAGRFSGADLATAVSGMPQAGPDTYTSELWFRTTTTTGGKLLGFGDGVTSASSHYDRHIYMSDDGRLTYGVYSGGTHTVTSAKSYNDGQWHHAVASLSSEGMVFFVDGIKVGRSLSTTIGEPFTGRWKVGGDNLGGWPVAGSSRYFAGDIDDVAIYPTVLTQTQIRDHYTKSGRTLDIPPLPTDSYGMAVTADDPTFYWRLGEAGGTTALDASGNVSDGTYFESPTLGVASAVVVANTAAGFDGVNDLVSSNQSFNNPVVFSIEAWFNTTSTSGGKILGFGSSQTGNSGSYDRHIYMNSAGQLRFGAYTGQLNVAGSSGAFNDGRWHHVVATLGATGMKLFVDSALVATNANTGAQNYSGYWRVGGDNSWEANPYFQGTIDEVAVYDHLLDASQVLTHYRASAAAVNQAPIAAFQVGRNGLSPTFTSTASDPDGLIASHQWDFGDAGTSTDVSPTHTYAAAGTYLVSLTVTDSDGLTASSSQSVTVRETLPPPSDAYGITVSGDEPLLYWRLDELSGTLALDSTPNFYDGDYYGGVFLGETSGVVGGTGAVGLGASEFVSSKESFSNPMTFSLETWFTSAQDGGRIFGFSNQQSSDSNNYDRHIYLDGAGNLVFGTWSDGAYTVTTVGVDYGDDAWHHVVATFGPSGMVLYVDGVAQAGRPEWVAQNYVGYWRVGDDSFWGSGDFTGLIDEAAVYDKVLSADQVAAHYAAGSGTTANVRPVASFDAAVTNLSVAFDASGSSDADGSLAGYAWDFGDGTTASGISASHTYAAAGTYQVSLVVTDDRGATGTSTRGVTVSPANAAPVASFTHSATDLSVTFDGSASSDADGSIVGYAWEFGDGATGSGASASHTYAVAGSFTVRLTVTDDRGATGVTTRTVGVTAPNVAPLAAFTSSATGLSVALDGSGSSDADGIASYSWDFGDGASGTGMTVSHAYAAAGSFTVTLTVTDPRGASDTETKTVTVTAPATNTAPVASFTATPAGLSVAFDGSASSDVDGSVVGYGWSFGDGATASGVSASHTYAAAGTYSVTLTVTDNQGGTDEETRTVVASAVVLVVSDQFARSVASGWGTAEVGGVWTVNSSSTMSVDGSSAVVRFPAAGSTRTAFLNAVSVRDVSVVTDFTLDKVPVGGHYYQQVVARVSGTSWYMLTARLETTGTLRVYVSRVVSGTETVIRTTVVSGFAYTAGETVKVRFDVAGDGTTSTLSGTVWRSTVAEPVAPTVTATDATASLQAAGGLGLKMYTGAAMTSLPLVVRVGSYTAEAK